jgi:pimeloyl-ACP methyl ester carboxylesterase
VLVINGQGDALASNAHAGWYRDALPDARVEMVPGVGHLVLVPQWERILSWVAPEGGER